MFFAGDTGYTGHFNALRERYGPMRLSLLPIGAYLPRWFMAEQHMDPAEAVQAHLDLQSAFSLGIHYGSFDLADDGQQEPVIDLAAARVSSELAAGIFEAAEFGIGREFPPLDSSTGVRA